jgi:hypothetical protein
MSLEMPIDNMTNAAAALIIGIVMLAFIVFILFGIDELQNFFDNLFVSEEEKERNEMKAKASTEALVDSINCVADPDNCEIDPGGETHDPDDYKEDKEGISGSVAAQGDSDLVKVECETNPREEEPKLVDLPPNVEPDPSIHHKCEPNVYEEFRWFRWVTVLDNGNTCKFCENGKYDESSDKCKTVNEKMCTIKNFHLPENFAEFGSAEEYISGFGDPSFLVYWQNFPAGEDAAWSSFSAWYQGVGAVMFAGMCASRFLGPALKGAKWIVGNKRVVKLSDAIKQGGESVKENIGTLRAFLDKYKTRLNSWTLRPTKSADIADSRALVPSGSPGDDLDLFVDYESTLTQAGKLSALKSAFGETSLTWLKAEWKPAMSKAMTYTGIATLAAYSAARIDTELGKFYDQKPNNMVLSKPLKTPDLFALENLEIVTSHESINKNVPIILDKSNTWVYDSPFYLASPCHTDLKVTSEYVLCEGYSYDSVTKIASCGVITVADREFPSDATFCGHLSFVEISGSHEIFSDNNNDGEWDELILYNSWSGGSPTQTIPGIFSTTGSTEIEHINLKDTDNDGRLDYMAQTFYNGDVVVTIDSDGDGEFDLIDTDNDGEYEIQLRDFFAQNAEAYSDKDDDGVYETSLGETEFIEIDSYLDWGTSYDAIKYTNPKDFTRLERLSNIDIYRNSDGGMEAVSTPGMVFIDVNDDGYFDYAQPSSKYPSNQSNGFWQCDEEEGLSCSRGSHVVKSSEGNGYRIETIGLCYTKAIAVGLENQDDYEDEHNFCYQQESQWLTFAVTSGEFALDAFVKRFTGPIGWGLATVADCGIAYYEIFHRGKSWPDNEIL